MFLLGRVCAGSVHDARLEKAGILLNAQTGGKSSYCNRVMGNFNGISVN
jgi:hypothetical protein